jgi:hypothetical protein
MTGVLLGAFCERGGADATRCLELWAYPDTSLNLVVNRYGPDGEEEYSFPCAPHHLVNVLRHLPFKTVTIDGTVIIERQADRVTTHFTSADLQGGWMQSVPVEPFVSALAQVAPEAESFQA